MNLTISRGLDTAEGLLGGVVVALRAEDPAGDEGVTTVRQLVTPAIIAADALSCTPTVLASCTSPPPLLPFSSRTDTKTRRGRREEYLDILSFERKSICSVVGDGL